MLCGSLKGSAGISLAQHGETVPPYVLLPPAGNDGNSRLEACSCGLLGTSYKTWLEGSGGSGGGELLHPVLSPLDTPLLKYMLSYSSLENLGPKDEGRPS